jgi:hypothetical protein
VIVASLLFAGAVIGIAATLLFAMWLATRTKPQPETRHTPIAMGLGGNAVGVESVNKEILDRVFKAYGDNKLFKIPTRH